MGGNSNTTLVKVKSLKNFTNYSKKTNSNTTLVKVKFNTLSATRSTQLQFKYNTC